PGLDGDVFFADFHDPAYVAEAAPERPGGGAGLGAPGRLCELLNVKGRAGGIARIDEAVAVVVATVATDLEAAGVAATITIGVALCEIRDVHAVVARVTHEIAVAVALIGIGDRRAVVADVGDAVAVAVRPGAGGGLEPGGHGVDDVVEVPGAVSAGGLEPEHPGLGRTALGPAGVVAAASAG